MNTMIATRLGGEPIRRKAVQKVVCQFWLQGNCNRKPCRFFHPELSGSNAYLRTFKPLVKRQKPLVKEQTTRKHLSVKEQKIVPSSSTEAPGEYVQNSVPKMPESCGSECTRQLENSPALNPAVDESIKPLKEACQDCFWFNGENWFFRLAQLKGHTEAICGIGLLPLSNNLCSVSIDGTICIWDCHKGQPVRVNKLGEEIGCLIIEGPWVFIGLQNLIKACNVESAKEFDLGDEHGSFGLVTAMVAVPGLEILISGTKDGSILGWKGNTKNAKPFQLAASLKGHTAAVTCLNVIVATKRLYSSAMDCTIRVWDLGTSQCLQTLTDHTDPVMSLVRWNEFLLSCSLDKTIKVWAATEEDTMKVIYSRELEHGAAALCGIHDQNKKPVLLCSCSGNCVHLYDLPSFKERGRIVASKEVRTIESGPEGLFFTGDGKGLVDVWKLSELCSRVE